MLHVRPATPGDLDTIVLGNMKLAEESENMRLDPATLRPGITALLEGRAPGVYWVAELDGQVVGQLLITYEWSDWRNCMVWWIQSVYVAPEARARRVESAVCARPRRGSGRRRRRAPALRRQHEHTGAGRICGARDERRPLQGVRRHVQEQ